MTWMGDAKPENCAADAAPVARGHSMLAALADGWRIAAFRPSRNGSGEYTAGTFWTLFLVSAVVSFVLSFMAVDPPRAFSWYGAESEGFYALVLLLLSSLACHFLRGPNKVWCLATVLMAAGIVGATIIGLARDHVIPLLSEYGAKPYWALWIVAVTWWVGIWRGALLTVGLGGSDRVRFSYAFANVVVLAALSFVIVPTRHWDKDYAAEYEMEHGEDTRLIAEDVFSRQPDLLAQKLKGLAAGVPGRPDLYFVAFGPYGYQDVFLKESLYSTRLFESRFGAQNRALTLVNNKARIDDLPLATVTNLDAALKGIATQMNVEEDILFLFLTSHGSRDAELSVRLEGLTFKPLTALALAGALKESGILWRVLVVSGCYSGTFLDALSDDRTLVITAARSDRTSFGCSDGAEFTYFGRAFLEHALNRTHSFDEAFKIASDQVGEWETKEGRERSEPQMRAGKLIGPQLEEWRKALQSGRLGVS